MLRPLGILGANGVMLVLGAGLLPVLRLAASRREVAARLPLAYAVGLAATGILAAELAVVDVPVGWVALGFIAAASLALGVRRLRGAAPAWRGGGGGVRRAVLRALPGLALALVAGAFFVQAGRLLAVKPLLEYDGWGIWATRARALYLFGHPAAPVFTDAPYQALQHPLLLPSLEALDARAMRTWDGTAVHLQLLGFAVALVGGGWGLLRRRSPPLLLAACLLAALLAPTFFNQLPSNYADVPLAAFVAVGVASLGAWLQGGGSGLLPAAALFLAAGALTKNEGEMFALAAFVAAALVARRAQRRPLALAAVAVVAADLPWRIWIWAHDVKIAEYSLADLFSPSYLYDHRGRVGPSASALWTQIWRLESWSFVVPLVFVGLAGAVALRRFRPAAFAAAWLTLSFAGLLAIYWISTNPLSSNLFNSSDRTIDSLVIGGALLVPVLLEREPEVRELRRDRRGRLQVEDLGDLGVLPDQLPDA
jgi:hypothetical protein